MRCVWCLKKKKKRLDRRNIRFIIIIVIVKSASSCYWFTKWVCLDVYVDDRYETIIACRLRSYTV